jgi:hypothetical protein
MPTGFVVVDTAALTVARTVVEPNVCAQTSMARVGGKLYLATTVCTPGFASTQLFEYDAVTQQKLRSWQPGQIFNLTSAGNRVYGINYAPAGTYLFSFDPASGAQIFTQLPTSGTTFLSAAPDGSIYATVSGFVSSQNRPYAVYHVASGAVTLVASGNSPIYETKYSSTGRLFLETGAGILSLNVLTGETTTFTSADGHMALGRWQ